MKIVNFRIAILWLLLAGLVGCVCAQSQSGDDVAQIIVKFKDVNTEPATATLLSSLSQTTKLKVKHLRPMSGGAQIYVLSGDDALVAQALQKLAARPDVEFAELDRKLKPQKTKANAN